MNENYRHFVCRGCGLEASISRDYLVIDPCPQCRDLLWEERIENSLWGLIWDTLRAGYKQIRSIFRTRGTMD